MKSTCCVIFFLTFCIACTIQTPFISAQEIPEKLFIEMELKDGRSKRMKNMDFRPLDIVEISAVGDLMMGSWVVDLVTKHSVDYPFDSTRSLLKSSDIAIANLEAPLTASGEKFENKTYTFKVPPMFAKGIKNAGIDIVTLANNHIVDFGCEGLRNTINSLDSEQIQHCGAGADKSDACQPVYIEHAGIRVAFISFSMTFPDEFWASNSSCGTCYPTEALLEQLVKTCNDSAGLTVVSFHWGAEKRTTPKDYQIFFAHKAIDLGADLVLGHHPHVLQGLELYKGKLIAYSLGNYVFGSFSRFAKTSIVLQALISPHNLLNARIWPISVDNYKVQFQPRQLRNEQAAAVIENLNELSRPLNGGQDIIGKDGCLVLPKVKNDLTKIVPFSLRQ